MDDIEKLNKKRQELDREQLEIAKKREEEELKELAKARKALEKEVEGREEKVNGKVQGSQRSRNGPASTQ